MTREELEQRLGKPDIEQMRKWLQIAPEERLRIMLNKQKIILAKWRKRLRDEYPELSDLELTKLVFEQIEQNEPITYSNR